MLMASMEAVVRDKTKAVLRLSLESKLFRRLLNAVQNAIIRSSMLEKGCTMARSDRYWVSLPLRWF
jgi:hypothetical protein